MPWHIGEHADCNGIAVIKDSDGSLAGCHETEAEAEAQMAALYANEPEATEEQEPGGPEMCVCPECGHEIDKERGVPCRSIKCPECGTAMVAKTSEDDMGELTEEKAGNVKQDESAVQKARTLIERALALLADEPGDNGHEPVGEAALSESATGRVIAIEEAETTPGLVPLTLDVALIEPGPGNAHDRHYYPAEVLRRDASVFKGGKMHATDHRENEKNVGTWVSTIKACPVGFTESGAPIARVVVHKDWFAKDIRALQAEGLLEKMECSIIGSGKAKKGTINEQEYNIVEAITEGSADWVTRAGAGGHALALAESDQPIDGGVTVDEQKQVKEAEVEETEVQEAETVTLREEENGEQPQEQPEVEVEDDEKDESEPELEAETEDTEPTEAALPAERTSELLAESGLGEDAQRLLARAYPDEQAVVDAIAEFKRILKKASGSGQPFAQGDSAPAQQRTELTEADRVARYRRIKERYGLTYETEVEK